MVIPGLVALVVVQYLAKRFEFTSGFTSLLINLLEYNEFIGLAFYILTTTVLLFFMYQLYKLLKIDYDQSGSIDYTYLENQVKRK